MANNTEIDVDYLVTLVEAHPVLWDKSRADYNDKFLKTDAWKRVCQCLFPKFEELGSEVKTKLGHDVIKRWRGVKDNFTRYEKKINDPAKSGAGANKIKPYHLYNQLLFLKKNDQSDDDELASTTGQQGRQKTTMPICQSAPHKRKMEDYEDTISKSIKNPESRHMSFFKGILPSVEKLNDDQTLIFQSRVLQILTDLYQPAWCPPRQYQPTHQTNLQTSYERTFSPNPSQSSCLTSSSPRTSSKIQHRSLECEANLDPLITAPDEPVDIKKDKLTYSESENEDTDSN